MLTYQVYQITHLQTWRRNVWHCQKIVIISPTTQLFLISVLIFYIPTLFWRMSIISVPDRLNWQLVFKRKFYIICSCSSEVWGTGSRGSSTSNCLILQVSPRPHKLWHSSPSGWLSGKKTAHSVFCIFWDISFAVTVAAYCMNCGVRPVLCLRESLCLRFIVKTLTVMWGMYEHCVYLFRSCILCIFVLIRIYHWRWIKIFIISLCVAHL